MRLVGCLDSPFVRRVLDDGQVLVDSSSIIDHFDRQVGSERSLTPLAGPERIERSSHEWLVLGRMTQADVTAAIAVTNLRSKNPEMLIEPRFAMLQEWTARCEDLAPFRAAPFMEA